MKIAYLVLAHQHPKQLARLVAALPDSSPVFIHIDAKASGAVVDEARALLAQRGVVFVKRHACWWGGYGIVDGTFELIRAALNSAEAFDYATLLSGADYPIQTNSHIEQYLAARPGAEHIESFRIDQPNKWTRLTDKLRAPDRTLRFHFRWGRRTLPLWWRSMSNNLLPYGGAQWWTLSRAALAYLDRYVSENRDFVAFFKASYIPDEAVFQTILANSTEFGPKITNYPLRLVIWDRPAPPYPAVLALSDMPAIKASPCHFARKFDPENADVLAAIDEHRLL